MDKQIKDEVKSVFLRIKKDSDLNYDNSIDKARLFIKIIEALSRVDTPKEIIDIWNKLIHIKKELSYDCDELQTNYNQNTYRNRINIKVKNNLELINKTIKFYYDNVKDSFSDEEDFFPTFS